MDTTTAATRTESRPGHRLAALWDGSTRIRHAYVPFLSGTTSVRLPAAWGAAIVDGCKVTVDGKPAATFTSPSGLRAWKP